MTNVGYENLSEKEIFIETTRIQIKRIKQMVEEFLRTKNIPENLPKWFTERMFQKILNITNQTVSWSEFAATVADVEQWWEKVEWLELKKFDLTHEEITAIAKFIWINSEIPSESYPIAISELISAISCFCSFTEEIHPDDLKEIPYLQEIFWEYWAKQEGQNLTRWVSKLVSSFLSKLINRA